MGEIHNELRRGPVGPAIKFALGDSQGQGQIERYSETLQPVFDVWERPEWEFLRQEKIWATNVVQPPVVGEFGGVGVINPTGSSSLLVVEKAIFRSGAAQAFLLGTNTQAAVQATLASTQNVIARDLRWTPQFARALVTFGTDIATGSIISNTVEQAITQPGGVITEDARILPLVLPPGFAYVVVCAVANQQLIVTLAGRERIAFPGELQS